METISLKAEPRKDFGTRRARGLREAGRLPVVIYGHGMPTEGASIDAHEAMQALAHGAHMVELDLNGTRSPYLIKDIQYDHLQDKPIHMDLTRVDLTERVKVKVGIELRGTPKGVSDGGLLDLIMSDIEIECVVTEIPDKIQPIVTNLGLNESLLVKDLTLPAGVVAIADPDAIVAMVRPLSTTEEEPAEPTDGEESKEPERIGRVRPTEEEAGK